MNATQWSKTITVAAALALAPMAAGAQSTSMPGAQGSTTLQPRPSAHQDDLDAWMRDYSVRNDGRITRQDYLDEIGRRWDAMDANRQGLAPADASRLTGHVDSNTLAPLTGSGVQAGNMGPGNSKGK